ncbi:2-oxoglutarate and iron-dependent oxygenase domain-containing protein [Phenylobacterium sp.]|uniref:isopenicillin N synthase family dioxygenase n=1 Tax=Phenylobacterium sp. TaxID=1871053 RepID=UPI001225BF92|nr:2-oxoglutarate and iron-dependent oxygenase domain-containing protein [Phenylobacterium sp.]THD61588.1 MAG: isopenicillin N synthase family oxygenase [Phenylobacterium sp.]
MTDVLPVIDMEPLFDGSDERIYVAAEIAAACEAHGFFYLVGHRIPPDILRDLGVESRRFFALPEAEKMAIAMSRGGRAWRGYFPVGGELTSGRPDLKEGLYLGTELAADHPRVRAGMPLHGANLWSARPAGLQRAATGYIRAATAAAAALMEGVSLSLGLTPDYFARTYSGDPTVLFRIFHYPARSPAKVDWRESWGVAEHTDYGLLTLLAQDRHGGLQVKTPGGWIEAPPIEGALVCNIGDMLERLSGGRFRSTPHRVRNVSGQDRLSFPLFFDPDFQAPMRPLPIAAVDTARIDVDRAERWDRASVHSFEGTYGDYLLGKVAKVFPHLIETALGAEGT